MSTHNEYWNCLYAVGGDYCDHILNHNNFKKIFLEKVCIDDLSLYIYFQNE